MTIRHINEAYKEFGIYIMMLNSHEISLSSSQIEGKVKISQHTIIYLNTNVIDYFFWP